MARLDHRRPGRDGRRGRSQRVREVRHRFLIVCEGEETEPSYFRAFPVPAHVACAVHGEGRSTLSLVKQAVRLADAERRSGRGAFDEVWVVYDQDDFGAERFNAADQEIRRLDRERGETWRAAWSNQAFEVWYLLHFGYFDARLHRDQVAAKLAERLGGYRKNDPLLYDRLLAYQPEALRHAARLERHHGVDPHGATRPADADPCTLVHRLVEALNAQLG